MTLLFQTARVILCIGILGVCSEVTLADNLDSERVDSSNQGVETSGFANAVGGSGPDIDEDSDYDQVLATTSSFAQDSGGANQAEVLSSGLAECPTAPSATATVPQCLATLDTQYSSTNQAGSSGFNAQWSNSHGDFEILPHPTNSGITGGTLYGVMDLITEWQVAGTGVASVGDTYLLAQVGSFAVTGFIGTNGWELTVFYGVEVIETIDAGFSLNLIFTTSEYVVVSSQQHIEVTFGHLGSAQTGNGQSIVATNMMSGEVSYEVEAGGSPGPASIWVDEGEGPELLWSEE